MEIAYILIQCDLGAEVQIINEIMKIPEIKEVRGTYGIYDVFCKVQSDTKEELDQIITNKIRKIQKIRSTITLHYIPSQGGK
ncbi:MAG: transcriptional regulator [Nitrosopumilales archaeon CG11_big_fil_rev_8_21_14_0_20_33_24]|jgi:DNA-binding Lrp family transcriptional regulator|nr:MAG: transcriptional regulator [Nitrosopumilales archaeon CG11_big_fil_rev_8_21_14_0_20_33_24]PIY88507.1 MAG: transcriptional regulator [Nitrosopumilales archaeon CG_4_10_14_0_8_um_filter_34_8]